MAKCKLYDRSKKSDDLFHRNNEDYMMHSRFSFMNDVSIDVIALSDGMGGLEDGQVASHAAVQGFMSSFYQELMQGYIPQRRNFTIMHYCNQIRYSIIAAMKAANRNVHATAAAGIQTGTTLSVAVIVGNYLIAANVGDSPIYYYNAQENEMELISTLQTKAEQDYYAGKYERYSEEYYNHDYMLTNYLGKYGELSEDIIAFHIVEQVDSGDMLLVCSDGAVGYQTPQDIAKILTGNEEELALSQLFEVAGEDKEDDQTVVFVKIV